jgi:hypothetical protein
MKLIPKISLAFAAGCMGGLLNSMVLWFFGAQGINQFLGVKLAPELTPAFLYPRLVWGGLWGFLFLFSWRSQKIYQLGLIYSLAPTLMQLFLVFPYRLNMGFLGLQLGQFTPLLVVFFNAVWGLGTAWWLHLATKSLKNY